MIRGSLTFRVRARPQVVFDYLADLERSPEWVPDLVSVTKLTEGPVGVGTRYSEVIQMGKRQGEGTLEVTAHDPPRVFAHDGIGGPSRFTARFEVEPDGDECVVTHDYTVKLTGLFKLMTPFMASWIRKNTDAAITNLQRVIGQREGAGIADDIQAT